MGGVTVATSPTLTETEDPRPAPGGFPSGPVDASTASRARWSSQLQRQLEGFPLGAAIDTDRRHRDRCDRTNLAVFT